ncbi:CIC11C00000004755 [Sungouiella intermedia]|uniref:CIC11C00000004755 n=1 Tax=Sungouiella intermedia TaxID=45354 RepID=A0A1L0G8P2_9ASCO|nr:CIC11C00000004755 [[Candida] intermedia]
MPPRPLWLIKEDEITEEFLKGGRGPGGQKINKSNSKVQLTHKPTGIVVTCQYSRSQELNRKRAREILALKLEELENPDNCRTAVINQRKMMVKKNKSKKSKKKYTQVDEDRQAQP